MSGHRRRRLDVRVVPHRRRSPFRLRDWRMRTKLAAVLIIPSVAFLVLAGVQARGLVGQAGVLNDFAQQVAIGREITAAVHQLQQERDRSAGELAGLRTGSGETVRTDPVVALKPLQTATDEAMQRLRQAAEPLADSDAAWRVSYSEVLEAYDQVVYIRSAVGPGVLSSDAVLTNYHRLIDELLNLLAEPSPGPDAPALSDAVLRYVQLARVKELSSRIRAQLYVAARTGRYGVEDQVLLTDLRAQQLTALGAFRIAATADQIRRYDRTTVDPAFVSATKLEEQSLPVGGAEPAVLPATQWWAASEQRHELLRQVEAGVLADAVTQADQARGAQLRQTLLVVGGIVAVLLVALLISVLIGRSIARSMRLLRGQALRIAQLELPDTLDRLRTVTGGVPEIEVAPAVVRSLDEIGELAEAFVAVHRSAVSVAVEQATMRRNVNLMFVNLARRSQVLVERQLELLDDLERDESDPDQLENLFKLDHLAARMRRNDESLLVLSGSESSRRWNRPIGLSSVLLAAGAEIEQYQRVRHDSVADLYVVGHAVGELVHLLAELLENATAFSRPDTVVRVTARAADGGAVIEIADQGLGMSPAALEQTNRLLASPPAADVAASERMGLFVVGHLAARHAIEVRLHGGQDGVVARVTLPAALLAAAPERELRAPASRRMLTAALAGAAGRAAVASRGGATGTAQVARRAGGGSPAGPPTVPAGSPTAPVGPPSTAAVRPSTAAGPAGVPDGAAPGSVPNGAGPAGRPGPAGATVRPGPGGAVGPPAPDGGALGLPVAGRRPGGPRPVPTRAEDVLAPASGEPPAAAGSTWWSRKGPSPSAAGPVPAAPTPPATPVTGGVNERGLPVRVPMAQLAAVTQSARPAAPSPRHDPDPEAVGGMLSRLYRGVRRAEAEDDTREISLSDDTREMPVPPTGVRSEGDKH
ncbi:sensor histidine kinase [Micromonospora cathayae]|uniref:histidine kinase n=1 Tax=Micromonospora cathayae TaxID=3028804 RepID=A0ABY7ZM22_9ACTN|nr:nitrate- and nitrite sensing domain-containing protein [Micromonospora sp. HUAS 3]WDZ84067.1 nitrate- and nitrite sensing domain-containing protein [Micromonospora sp. HUAS 3]